MNLKTPKVIEYTLFSLIFTLPVAWASLFAVCLNDWLPGICEQDYNYPLLTILVVILTLAPLGFSYHERALKRARRGMWAKPRTGQRIGQVFERLSRWAIGPERTEPAEWVIGEERFEARGWWCWVEVDGGRTVWVDRGELWQWLLQVEQLRLILAPGESPISQRRWEPELGRELWMAYCDILEAVGGVEYPTGDPRSRRYVSGAPWDRVEKYERLRLSEVR